MRLVMVIVMFLALAGSTMAWELGNGRDQTPKPHHQQVYENPADHKQGGDTIDDAVPIGGLPFTATGTTEGFVNDYDGVCPYLGSRIVKSNA